MISDRVPLIVAIALTTGGWVCGETDLCPDGLTCSTDVTAVCCPPGSPFWCNGNCEAEPSCSEPLSCVYLGDSVDEFCAPRLVATITTASCAFPLSAPPETLYTLEVAGTVSGCGSEPVVFATDSKSPDNVQCGTWTYESAIAGCSPPSKTEPATSSWRIRQSVAAPEGASKSFTFSVILLHNTRPVLAHETVTCGPT